MPARRLTCHDEAVRARGAALDLAGNVRLALGAVPANTVLDLADVDELVEAAAP